MPFPPKPLPEISQRAAARFWSHVDQRGPTECWPWKITRFKDGYGSFSLGGRTVLAHRVAFQLSDGRTTDAAPFVLHDCDYKPCCNPAHLFAGTHSRNMQDMVDRVRGPYAKGEMHHMTKLSQAQVDEIRAWWPNRQRGEVKATADRLGIRRQTLRRIAVGMTWKAAA